jgi:hypothetical protein
MLQCPWFQNLKREIMSNYIYSTAPTDYAFAVYVTKADGTTEAVNHILVKGGGSMPTPHGLGFHTPLGVVTEVSDSDLESLRKDWTFNHFVSQGFMTVDSNKVDVEKVASDMNINVPSAPASESDILDLGAPDGVEIKIYEDKPGKKSKK